MCHRSLAGRATLRSPLPPFAVPSCPPPPSSAGRRLARPPRPSTTLAFGLVGPLLPTLARALPPAVRRTPNAGSATPP
eukprot:435631-Alexandrium_andersonii.AAC.1